MPGAIRAHDRRPQALEHQAERKINRSASGVHKVLVRHNLGIRTLRTATLATLPAADTGAGGSRAMEPFGVSLVRLPTWGTRDLDAQGKRWRTRDGLLAPC
jgi:hypothetical protein